MMNKAGNRSGVVLQTTGSGHHKKITVKWDDNETPQSNLGSTAVIHTDEFGGRVRQPQHKSAPQSAPRAVPIVAASSSSSSSSSTRSLLESVLAGNDHILLPDDLRKMEQDYLDTLYHLEQLRLEDQELQDIQLEQRSERALFFPVCPELCSFKDCCTSR